MSLTNMKERQMLQEWSEVHSDEGIFDQRYETNVDSYFITRSREDTYIMKYKFENIPQLQESIGAICSAGMDEHMQKLLAIAAFKCKPVLLEDKQGTETNNGVDRGRLPEFTYAF